MRDVVVVGATGMIGRETVRLLGTRQDIRVHALVRKSATLPENVRQHVFAFGEDKSYARLGTPELPCDAILCCIGTTMKTAGSEPAFKAVEHDIPVRLIARALSLSPRPPFGFISSAGAGKPFGFYLNTKAAVEAALEASGLPAVTLRPSVLLGDRQENRPGERLAMLAMPPVFNALSALTGKSVGWVERLRPIDAATVAAALVHHILDAAPAPGLLVLEGAALRRL